MTQWRALLEWWRNPIIRARLLAAFLAANAAMALLSLLDWIGWGWLVPGNWLGYLSASLEQGIADRYHGVLFGVVAVLAAAQALRRPPPRVGPRWLWAIGWVSLAALVGLIAVEELNRRVDAGSLVASALGLKDLAPRYGWVLVAAPLAAPLAAAALWCLLAAGYCRSLSRGMDCKARGRDSGAVSPGPPFVRAFLVPPASCSSVSRCLRC